MLGAVVLSACGTPNVAGGSAAAALACEQLVGVEDTVLKGEVTQAVELQTLAAAKQNADHAALDDSRWKRLDADITQMRLDILRGHTTTLGSKVTDAAKICSPLAESPPPTVP
jgi:hypothetical protein